MPQQQQQQQLLRKKTRKMPLPATAHASATERHLVSADSKSDASGTKTPESRHSSGRDVREELESGNYENEKPQAEEEVQIDRTFSFYSKDKRAINEALRVMRRISIPLLQRLKIRVLKLLCARRCSSVKLLLQEEQRKQQIVERLFKSQQKAMEVNNLVEAIRIINENIFSFANYITNT